MEQLDPMFGPWSAKYGPMLGLNDETSLKAAYVAYLVGAMEMMDFLKQSQAPNMN